MNLDYLIEYMKIHLVSLEQDLERAIEIEEASGEAMDSMERTYYEGSVETIKHLLAVAQEGINE